MDGLKIGDIVGRKSYGCDVLFKVASIKSNSNVKIAILKGLEYKLVADAPETDLVFQSNYHEMVTAYRRFALAYRGCGVLAAWLNGG